MQLLRNQCSALPTRFSALATVPCETLQRPYTQKQFWEAMRRPLNRVYAMGYPSLYDCAALVPGVRQLPSSVDHAPSTNHGTAGGGPTRGAGDSLRLPVPTELHVAPLQPQYCTETQARYRYTRHSAHRLRFTDSHRGVAGPSRRGAPRADLTEGRNDSAALEFRGIGRKLWLVLPRGY